MIHHYGCYAFFWHITPHPKKRANVNRVEFITVWGIRGLIVYGLSDKNTGLSHNDRERCGFTCSLCPGELRARLEGKLRSAKCSGFFTRFEIGDWCILSSSLLKFHLLIDLH